MWGLRRLQQMRISDLNATAFGHEHRVQGLVPNWSSEAVQTVVPGQTAMGGAVAQRRGRTVAEEIKELQHCASLVTTLYGLSSGTLAQVISTADHSNLSVGTLFHHCIIICMAYDTHIFRWHYLLQTSCSGAGIAVSQFRWVFGTRQAIRYGWRGFIINGAFAVCSIFCICTHGVCKPCNGQA